MRIATMGAVLCCAALAACATPQAAAPGSADQARQQELGQMEAQGQRNDIDKPFKK